MLATVELKNSFSNIINTLECLADKFAPSKHFVLFDSWNRPASQRNLGWQSQKLVAKRKRAVTQCPIPLHRNYMMSLILKRMQSIIQSEDAKCCNICSLIHLSWEISSHTRPKMLEKPSCVLYWNHSNWTDSRCTSLKTLSWNFFLWLRVCVIGCWMIAVCQ